MTEVGTAFVSVLPSAKGFGPALSKEVGGPVKSIGASMAKTLGGLAIGSAAIGFVKGAIAEGREANKVGALTAAVIKSTGGAAKVTAKQVDSLATRISLKTGIDDEAIASGENMLLTFANVRNEVGKGNKIFNEATTAATDMSVVFGGDATSNSKLLGKALNDPTAGVSALTRVGVSFTTQQKEQIKAMQESGNMLGAQKIIIGEVSKQTKGAAAAAATNGDKFRVAYGNLQETIGKALIPILDKMFGFLTNKIVPAIQGFITGMQNGTGAGGVLVTTVKTLMAILAATVGFVVAHATAFKVLAGALLLVKVGMIGMQIASAASLLILKLHTVGTIQNTIVSKAAAAASKVWAAGQWLLNVAMEANPIGLVIIAIIALVAIFVIAWKKSETFRKIVLGAWAAIKSATSAVWGFLKSLTSSVWNAIKGAVTGAVNGIKSVTTNVFNAVKGFISSVWNNIKSGVSSAVTTVKNAIGSAWSAIKSAASSAWDGIKGVITGALDRIVGIFKAAPARIKGAFGSALTMLSGIGGDIVAGLRNGIAAAWHFVTDKVNELIGLIPKAIRKLMGIGSPSKVTKELGQWTAKGLADGLTDGQQKVFDAAKGLVTKLKDGLKGIKDEAASFSDTVGGMFNTDAFNLTIPVEPVMQMIDGVSTAVEQLGITGLAAFQQTIASNTAGAQAMLAALSKAKANGLDGPLFQALAASGDLVTAQQIAALSAAQIADLEAAYAAQNKAQDQLGGMAADTVFGAQIDRQTKVLSDLQAEIRRVAKILDGLPKDVENGARAGTGDRARDTGQRQRNGR